MGWTVEVVEESICDKYTDALRSTVVNNAGLMSAIVGQTFEALTAKTSPLLEYFTGVVGERPDYTDPENSKELQKLAEGLVSFFSDALGCSDGSIPPYNEVNAAGTTLKEFHVGMPISIFEFNAFNDILLGVLKKNGVVDADLTKIRAVLESPGVKAGVCNFGTECGVADNDVTPPGAELSICDQTVPASEREEQELNGRTITVVKDGASEATLKIVVNDLVERLSKDAELKPFFDGSMSGLKNFLDATKPDGTELINNLVAFFGSPEVLACSNPNFPQNGRAVPVSAMKEIHKDMKITKPLFDKFNGHIAAAATDAGMTTENVQAVGALLASLEEAICNQPGCKGVSDQADAVVINVSVKQKAANHHFAGKGFGSAYQLDGKDVADLVLEVGQQYIFKVPGSCFHPFYLSTGTGAGSPDYIDVTTTPQYCNGNDFVFTPTADLKAKQLWYACRNHNFMGGRACVVDKGQTSCDTAPEPAPPLTQSPCDQMVASVKTAGKAGLSNANETLTAVVIDVFTKGAAAEGAPLKQYFDGTKPAGSRNFVGDSALAGELVFGLVKFFGTALGCTDNSISVYKPDEPQPDMKEIHVGMGINQTEFELFNTVLLGALSDVDGTGKGLPEELKGPIGVFLAATAPDVCSECGEFEAPSLCEKWHNAAFKADSNAFPDQQTMVAAVVTGVFTKLVAGPPGKEYFDGTVPCNSRDFVNGAILQKGLVRSLTAYFGQQSLLGCSQSSFPTYRGVRDMELLHKNMPINKALYTAFITAFAEVVKGALGGTDVADSLDADLAAVANLLTTDAEYSTICNQDDCDEPKGTFEEKQCPTPAPGPGGDTPAATPTAGPGVDTPAPSGTPTESGASLIALTAPFLALALAVVVVVV